MTQGFRFNAFRGVAYSCKPRVWLPDFRVTFLSCWRIACKMPVELLSAFCSTEYNSFMAMERCTWLLPIWNSTKHQMSRKIHDQKWWWCTTRLAPMYKVSICLNPSRTLSYYTMLTIFSYNHGHESFAEITWELSNGCEIIRNIKYLAKEYIIMSLLKPSIPRMVFVTRNQLNQKIAFRVKDNQHHLRTLICWKGFFPAAPIFE